MRLSKVIPKPIKHLFKKVMTQAQGFFMLENIATAPSVKKALENLAQQGLRLGKIADVCSVALERDID